MTSDRPDDPMPDPTSDAAPPGADPTGRSRHLGAGAPDPGLASGGRSAVDAGLDARWVEAMRRHGGTPADDATWQAIVDRAEEGSSPIAARSGGGGRGARAWWAVAAALVVAVVGAAAVIAMGDGDEGEQVQAGPVDETGWEAPAEEWERLPDPPLSPRDGVMSAWTGEELLVFGGTTWTCPPTADCVGPEPDQLLTDGAALDPATGEWRSIAPMPEPMLGGSAAVLGNDVYVLQGSSKVWHYSISDDRWDPSATEPGLDARLDQLIATDAGLVAISSSDEGQDEEDYFVLDAPGAEWRSFWPPGELLPLMFDRSAVWSAPYLYVFGKELVPNPGSEEPSLTIGARVALDTGEWERLPDSEILGNPYAASDGLLVSPQDGGADGGDVNNWGRTYPNGGIFDTATQSWRDLPAAPGGDDVGMTAGVLGSTTAWFDGGGGDLFDTTTESWTTMPALDEAPGAVARESWAGRVHTAGLDAVVVGGVDWSDDEPELLDDAWIWRSGRSGSAPEEPPADEPDSATTSPDTPGDDTRYFVAATVLDDGGGPELCLGGVATSLPPQCGGPPIEGWDWASVDGEESAAGTTWGDFEVIGTFDGTTFTLTDEPRPVDPSDDPELLDPPPDMEVDLSTPCPEPEGGWPPDPATGTVDEITAITATARSQPGYAAIWVDDPNPGRDEGLGDNDPSWGVITVAVAGGPDLETAMQSALREVWSGPLCITPAERTYRELEQAMDEARALAEDAGTSMLNASIDEVGNQVHVQVIAPAPRLQSIIDEQLGEGTVVLFSALRRLA